MIEVWKVITGKLPAVWKKRCLEWNWKQQQIDRPKVLGFAWSRFILVRGKEREISTKVEFFLRSWDFHICSSTWLQIISLFKMRGGSWKKHHLYNIFLCVINLLSFPQTPIKPIPSRLHSCLMLISSSFHDLADWLKLKSFQIQLQMVIFWGDAHEKDWLPNIGQILNLISDNFWFYLRLGESTKIQNSDIRPNSIFTALILS